MQKALCWFVFLTLGGANVHANESAKDPARELAERYGLRGWDQIQQLDFTFNVKLPNRDDVISRKWTWWPKEDRFMLVRPDKATIELVRSAASERTAEQTQADKWFINDTYWLLFPFQLVWSDPMVSEPQDIGLKLPIGDGYATTKVIVRFPDQGGYTPGDHYHLYLDANGLIEQWAYLPGGNPDNARFATWANNQRLGPLLISTDHRGRDGVFHLWFSEVGATLADGTRVQLSDQ